MSTGAPSLKRLGSLLKRIKGKYAPQEPAAADAHTPILGADRVLNELLTSMLLWNTTTSQARHALKRLHENLVDLNELRVCVAEEIADILGDKYPFAMERSLRLRSLLGDIYHREHSVHLTHLEGMGKREAHSYLESLDGVPHFAAARTFAFALFGHAVPVDDRLRALLITEHVASDAATCASLSGWLERSIGADDIRDCLPAFQAWADELGQTPKREPLGSEPPPSRVPSKVAARKPDANATANTDEKSDAKSAPTAKPVTKQSNRTAKPRAASAKAPKPSRKTPAKKDSKA